MRREWKTFFANKQSKWKQKRSKKVGKFPYVGKPRSDLDQHARNEKKLLIKNAIKKIQHAFLPNPEHAMCEYATQWSASAVSQYITYQYAMVSGPSVYQ